MNTLEAFQQPELEPIVNAVAMNCVAPMSGVPFAVGLAGLFIAFVGICEQAGVDAGTEFERTLATYEARKMATHRLHERVQ